MDEAQAPSATEQQAPVTEQSKQRVPIPEREVFLRTEELSKSYDEFLALDKLSIDLHEGEVFGYIGPNGAGKTTTFRLLAGLLNPTGGKAFIRGLDVTKSSERLKTMVGYMPDNFGVYEGMRVWEYLDFFGASFRIPKKPRRQRIDQVLHATQTETFKDRMMETLSKGMRQRVGIARTLIHDPSVLILDEPAAGLDPQSRIEMRHLLRVLADMGKAVLVSSHILPELASICDTIGILDKGRLLAVGRMEEIVKEIRRSRLVEIHVLSEGERAEKIIEKNHPNWKFVDSEPGQGIIRFQAEADERELSSAVKEIVEAGIPLLWSKEVPPDLEDAFMTLTGKMAGGR
jgi:ABC-2 type transport system ATP-binding protein